MTAKILHINWHTRTFDQRRPEEEDVAKILQFRMPSPDASGNVEFEIPVRRDKEAGDPRRETEAALKMDGFILIAWAVCRYGGHADIISAWYFPEDGDQWVYRLEYDKKTMKVIDSSSRTSRHRVYQWLKENRQGLFREFHLCAPLYILLDNEDLRKEYLAGNLEKIS
jgi:hypothetical protein